MGKKTMGTSCCNVKKDRTVFAVRYLRPAAVMLLLLLVCFAAFGCRSEKGEKGGENVTTVPETTLDPQEVRAGEIKSRVLEVINSDSGNGTINTDDLFGKYCGDYMISDISGSLNRRNVDFIALHSGVTTLAYKDSQRVYSTVREGYAFRITEEKSKYRMSVSEFANSGSYVSSVFDALGINISALFNPLSGGLEGIGKQFGLPPLTADMLTVDKELSSCAISEEYIAELARFFCRMMKYTDEQTKYFIEHGTFSGTYYVEPERVEFYFRGHKKDIETVRIWITSYVSAVEGNSTKVEIKPKYGINTAPRSAELKVVDLEKGSNGKLVAGLFEATYKFKNEPYDQSGVRGRLDTDQTAVMKFDTRPEAEKNVEISVKSKYILRSERGKNLTGESGIAMYISDGILRYKGGSGNGISGKLRMGTPDMPALPEEAEKMIEDYLSKNGAA